MKIEDGTGSKRLAKVDTRNRLTTYATNLPKLADISDENGDSYIMANGGFISITSTGTESGIVHIKNTSETQDLHISELRTCGTVVSKWRVYKNSTGGTLISDQTAGINQNMNFTSQNVPDSTVYSGGNAKTVSGGTMIGHHITDIGHSTDILEGSLILGRNDSIQITVELASAGEVCCRLLGYFE